MKKHLLLALLVVLATASAFGTGSQEEQPSQEEAIQDEGNELKVFVPQSPGLVEGITAVAEAFMEKNPGKTVTIRSVPFGKYKEQLRVMWSSDEVDDVVSFAPVESPTWAYFGSLLPLDDILPPSEQAKFIPSAIEAATYNGHIYSYPFRESCSAMYYNKEMFALAGVEPATLDKPWTWEEWRTNILKIRDAVKQATGKEPWGLTFLTNPGQGDFWITPIIRSNGEPGSNTYKAIADDGITLHGYADTPEAMEAYQFYQNLYTVDKLAPTAEVPDAFATGNAITMISFMQTGNLFNKQFPDLQWGVMPLPYFKTPVTHTSGFAYSISAKTKVPNLAKAFVSFAGSEEGIMTYFDTSGSELVSRIDFPEKHPEYYEGELAQAFTKILLKYGIARPRTPAYMVYNTIIGFQMFKDIDLGADIPSTVEKYITKFEKQAKSM